VEPADLGSVFAVAAGAPAAPLAVALLAPDRPETTYDRLAAHVREAAGWLRATGIEPGDRVALVLENGPEAATGFLAISSAAVCAPLNPSYRAAELEFYLADLRARTVVVGASLDTPARDVARKLGVEVLELEVDAAAPAGVFTLAGVSSSAEVSDPGPAAEALVLHTSGTTARPKIVPLAHRHLAASARNVGASLGLESSDRCLNVMPLFHIHGLVAGLLASLRAGGSVACTSGFHQLRFFDWLRGLEPTWTTAVPTMYQAVLERAEREPDLVTGHGLRFVRSSSAALPVPVLEGLERVLDVPVVEAYGMTEAAHQMASNPLPPAARKPGSVGRPAGPEIAILDGAGVTLPAGELGEVAIRGENVFGGYEANPGANDAAFTDGWFRTGDEGRLDADGYLVLQGRLKEIINRAGEKVSPLEVDDVLLRHPSVAQAVTFGIPHDRLGEEVAAAVVLRERDGVGERDLQDFVAQTVAPFKVPRRIVVVDEIPKGPTGKLQRIGLAERLELTEHDLASESSRSQELEELVAGVWSDVLEIPAVGPHDDFFALGGDSILGAEAIARVRELVGRPDLPLVAIVRAPTPRAMSAEVLGTLGLDGHGVLPLQPGTGGTPLFLAHAVDGDIVRYAALARAIGSERPVYGLRAPGHAPGEEPPADVETIAADYLDGIRAVQPSGPYLLGGFCMGAAVALELAHRLESVGERASLILVDPRIQRPDGLRFTLWLVPRRARERQLGGAVLRRIRHGRPPPPTPAAEWSPVWRALAAAREAYDCRPTSAPVALVRSEDFGRYELPDWYLRRIFRNIVSTEEIPGQHVRLFRPPALEHVTAAVRRALARVDHT
jgi:acyl-CoA synthetase (AMP-forming)/AMP-acid ligase II/thioesterase domain-containing protein